MKPSYVVTHKGDVVNTDNISITNRVRNQNARIEELDEFRDNLIISLKCNGMNCSTGAFVNKIQPLSYNDKLLLFCKIPVMPHEMIVKQANGIFLSDTQRYSDEMLKSVCCASEKEKTIWYILFVYEMSFERNCYDCEWQLFNLSQPIPYGVFIKSAYSDVLSPSDLRSRLNPYGYIYPRYEDLENVDKIVYDALLLENENNTISEKHKSLIKAIYEKYIHNSEYRQRNPYANIAFKCLTAINDMPFTDKLYPLYEKAKAIIKSELPSASYIRYEGNSNIIRFDYENKNYVIYVCSPFLKDSNFAMISNGKIFNNLDELKNGIRKVPFPCEWFDSIVLPNVKR